MDRRPTVFCWATITALAILTALPPHVSSWRDSGSQKVGTSEDPVYDKSVKGGDQAAAQAAAEFEPMELKGFRAYAKAKNFHRLGLGAQPYPKSNAFAWIICQSWCAEFKLRVLQDRSRGFSDGSTPTKAAAWTGRNSLTAKR